MSHFAHAQPFDVFYSNLQRCVHDKYVTEVVGENGLRLYCYSQKCTYEKAWDSARLATRGLILDVENKKIVATPFPKFFNYGEQEGVGWPNEEFEVFEKLDGSLIILFYHGGRWRTATKGSFKSEQAIWAMKYLEENCQESLKNWPKTNTYLFECIYPENRIVISYAKERYGLHLIGAYDQDGGEFTYDELLHYKNNPGIFVTERLPFKSFLDLESYVKTLTAQQEGFVVRFESGLRLKFKGDEYKRVHALISDITPLGIWNLLYNRDDTDKVRQQIPEEFWKDFDEIIKMINNKVGQIILDVNQLHFITGRLSDKELGLQLHSFSKPAASLIFPFRRGVGLLSGKCRDTIFRHIRPTGNRLEGYIPSYSINKVMEEQS